MTLDLFSLSARMMLHIYIFFIYHYFEARRTTVVAAVSSECNARHLEWTEMTAFGGDFAPNAELDIKVDSLLNLHLKIDLDYLGDSTWRQRGNYGTTYVIDFESYDAYQDKINQPNNCQNRISKSFESKPFSDWWKYSKTPYMMNHLGSNNYLAYPPTGDLWNITMLKKQDNNQPNDYCQTVRYQGLIPWMTLLSCKDKRNNKVITLTENEKFINASGTLYVNVVSPLNENKETNVYRVYQLISQPFVVSFQKMVNVVSSTKIQLFRMSILAVYKEGNDATDDNYFRLILLTESVEYLRLLSPQLIMYPQNGVAYETIAYSLTDTCLVSNSYTCGQLWEIGAKASCPPSNFSGLYGLTWTAQCAPYGSRLCETYLNDYDSSVSLVTRLTFIDEFCDPYIYRVIMDGEINFYQDSQFKYRADNYTYPVGDTVYIEVTVNFPTTTYSVLETHLVNALVCTFPEQYDVKKITVDQIKGTGGCLDSNIDKDGPYYPVYNKEAHMFNATLYDTSKLANNIVRFSFTVPPLPRPTMYVHSQIEVTLTDGFKARVLLQDNVNNNNNNNDGSQKKANRMSHFGVTTKVTASPQNVRGATNNAANSQVLQTMGAIIGIVVASLIATALIVAAVLYFYKPEMLHELFCMKQLSNTNNSNNTNNNNNNHNNNNNGNGGSPWCCSGCCCDNKNKRPQRTMGGGTHFGGGRPSFIGNNRHSGPSQRSSRASSVGDVILDSIVDNIKLDIESQNSSEKLD